MQPNETENNNAFEALCLKASEEKWCWNLACTTCGHIHFRYSFKLLAEGLHPSARGWPVRSSRTSYKAQLGPHPRDYTENERLALIRICRQTDIVMLSKRCRFPDWLGYLGLVINYCKSEGSEYEGLLSTWANQLATIVGPDIELSLDLTHIATSSPSDLTLATLESCEESLRDAARKELPIKLDINTHRQDPKDSCWYELSWTDLHSHPRIIAARKDVKQRIGKHMVLASHAASARMGHEYALVSKSLEQAHGALSPNLAVAYAATNYCVEYSGATIVLKAGVYSDQLRQLLSENNVEQAAFITAFNPDSQQVTDDDNTKAQAALSSVLQERGYSYLRGYGQDPDKVWPAEPSLLVFGIPCGEAIGLASKLGQVAFVWVSKDAIPKIVVVGGSNSKAIHLKTEWD